MNKNLGGALIDINLLVCNQINGFDQKLRHKNVSVDTAIKILHLLKNNGRLTPSEITAKLCIANANLSNQCSVMMDNQLIRQFNDTNDRRAICYGICPKGEELYESIVNTISENLKILLTDNSNKDEIIETIFNLSSLLN